MNRSNTPSPLGRGARFNPPNRFEPTHHELELDQVKEDAPELLRKALSSPRWQPRVLALSGVTDPYQPLERRLGLTRRCLAVLAEFRQAVSIITKNRLVTRDVDLLGDLARQGAAGVF